MAAIKVENSDELDVKNSSSIVAKVCCFHLLRTLERIPNVILSLK